MQSELRQWLGRQIQPVCEHWWISPDGARPCRLDQWRTLGRRIPCSPFWPIGSRLRNPNVDGMRYDVIDRKKALEDPSVQQRLVEEAACQSVRDTFTNDKNPDESVFGGSVGTTEGNDDSVEWSPYTDQRLSPGSSLGGASGNELLGFMQNIVMSGSIYGSGRTNYQSVTNNLQSWRVKLWCSQYDTGAWRGIGKELKLDPGFSEESDDDVCHRRLGTTRKITE